jgi:osmoprotectant transport system substrate-binding protein
LGDNGRVRRVVRLAAYGLVLVLLAACGGGGSSPEPAAGRRSPITVASFGFSESRTLAELYSQALEHRGLPVRRAFELASREVVEPALEQGKVDLVPEYVGTALRFLQPRPQGTDAYEELRRVLAARGVTVLTPAAAEDKNGIVVTRATARRLGLAKVSDLASVASTMSFGGPPECPERPLCLPGLRSAYGLTFRQFRALDAGGPATLAALEGGEVDVALLFTTDGHLAGDEFVLLADDRELQPRENVVPVVRTQVVDAYGAALVDTLDGVSSQLHNEDLISLNRRVAIERVAPEVAAGDWLRLHGLI